MDPVGITVSWLQPVNKRQRMNFVEDFCIQTFRQRNENTNDKNKQKHIFNVIYGIRGVVQN